MKARRAVTQMRLGIFLSFFFGQYQNGLDGAVRLVAFAEETSVNIDQAISPLTPAVKYPLPGFTMTLKVFTAGLKRATFLPQLTAVTDQQLDVSMITMLEQQQKNKSDSGSALNLKTFQNVELTPYLLSQVPDNATSPDGRPSSILQVQFEGSSVFTNFASGNQSSDKMPLPNSTEASNLMFDLLKVAFGTGYLDFVARLNQDEQLSAIQGAKISVNNPNYKPSLAPTSAPTAPPPSPGGISPLLIGIIVLLIVLVIAGLAALYYFCIYKRPKKRDWKPKPKEEKDTDLEANDFSTQSPDDPEVKEKMAEKWMDEMTVKLSSIPLREPATLSPPKAKKATLMPAATRPALKARISQQSLGRIVEEDGDDSNELELNDDTNSNYFGENSETGSFSFLDQSQFANVMGGAIAQLKEDGVSDGPIPQPRQRRLNSDGSPIPPKRAIRRDDSGREIPNGRPRPKQRRDSGTGLECRDSGAGSSDLMVEREGSERSPRKPRVKRDGSSSNVKKKKPRPKPDGSGNMSGSTLSDSLNGSLNSSASGLTDSSGSQTNPRRRKKKPNPGMTRSSSESAIEKSPSTPTRSKPKLNGHRASSEGALKMSDSLLGPHLEEENEDDDFPEQHVLSTTPTSSPPRSPTRSPQRPKAKLNHGQLSPMRSKFAISEIILEPTMEADNEDETSSEMIVSAEEEKSKVMNMSGLSMPDLKEADFQQGLEF